MDFNALVAAMSAETYQNLVECVATKRWADGTLMSDAQHAHSMQLVMAYQAKILRSDEPFTIGADGQMVVKSKTEMKKQFAGAAATTPVAMDAIARFSHDDL
jgi:uncharacterized protein